MVGLTLGFTEGLADVGIRVVGFNEGYIVGDRVVGCTVGAVGVNEGPIVGFVVVGTRDGDIVEGTTVGEQVGEQEGRAVG